MADSAQWHRVPFDRNGDPIKDSGAAFPPAGQRVLVSFVNPWTLKPQVYTARIESSEESLTGYKWLSAYTGGGVTRVYAWAEYPSPCPQEAASG